MLSSHSSRSISSLYRVTIEITFASVIRIPLVYHSRKNLTKCGEFATLGLSMSGSVEQLRQELFHEDIARRLSEGNSLRQIARNLNLRPEIILETTRSDDFLRILERVDRDLADDIRADIEAEKPLPFEDKVLKGADEAATYLRSVVKAGESQAVAAAKALLEIGGRVKKERPERVTRRTSFPASQLRNLIEAAREVSEMDKRIEKQSPGRDPVR